MGARKVQGVAQGCLVYCYLSRVALFCGFARCIWARPLCVRTPGFARGRVTAEATSLCAQLAIRACVRGQNMPLALGLHVPLV